MRIDGHQLQGERVAFRASPNQGGPFARPNPDTIIIHYTAGANAESAIRTLSDPARRVSAHLVVDRQGAVAQLVPFDAVAWHAGASRWGDREGMNQHTIGIEIDNAGQLQEQDGRLVSWFGRQYSPEQVVWGVHRHQTRSTPWHRYTSVQIQVTMELCRLLISAYGIDHILGHEEIAPLRKIDPGPAFPLDALRGELLGTGLPEGGSQNARVCARRLNIRSAPHGRAARVAGHLLSGTQLTVLEESGAWCRVRVPIEGWVSRRYIAADEAGEET